MKTMHELFDGSEAQELGGATAENALFQPGENMTDDEISEILLPLLPLKDPYVFARAIAAAEREACAKVAWQELLKGDEAIAIDVAAAIMARSNATQLKEKLK